MVFFVENITEENFREVNFNGICPKPTYILNFYKVEKYYYTPCNYKFLKIYYKTYYNTSLSYTKNIENIIKNHSELIFILKK